MTLLLNRRSFFALAPGLALFAPQPPASPGVAAPPASFPAHPPDLVREIVTVAHGNLARVRELVDDRPALARASWDWGYGDWESPIDAASHVGNRPIAEYLLAHGARPTVFTVAMLGQLATLRSLIEATPGIQRTRGPHGLTLLQHARAGRADAVASYLESLGDADPRYPNEALTAVQRSSITGRYTFGSGDGEVLEVKANAKGDLVVQRLGQPERNLFHHGELVFNPSGAEAVRLRFQPQNERAHTLLIEDGRFLVTARAV